MLRLVWEMWWTLWTPPHSGYLNILTEQTEQHWVSLQQFISCYYTVEVSAHRDSLCTWLLHVPTFLLRAMKTHKQNLKTGEIRGTSRTSKLLYKPEIQQTTQCSACFRSPLLYKYQKISCCWTPVIRVQRSSKDANNILWTYQRKHVQVQAEILALHLSLEHNCISQLPQPLKNLSLHFLISIYNIQTLHSWSQQHTDHCSRKK